MALMALLASTLARQYGADRHLAVPVVFQFVAAGGQHLGAQRTTEPVYHLDIQVEATPNQFGSGPFVRRQQGRLAAHFADQGWADAAAAAEGGPFRVHAAAAPAAATTCAGCRSVIQRGDPQQQATQQAHGERAAFGSPQRPVGLGDYFFGAVSTAGAARA